MPTSVLGHERARRDKGLDENFDWVVANGGNGDKESSETNIKSRNQCDRAGANRSPACDLIQGKT